MQMKSFMLNVAVSLVVATGVLLSYNQWFASDPQPAIVKTVSTDQSSPVRLAKYETASGTKLAPVDFTYAASKSTESVVHVRTEMTTYQPSGLEEFFFFGIPRGGEERKREASGSGVILSEDGYIVTNNHVISEADKIEVKLHDNRTYTAELIGTDPSTDLALLKVNEDGLPSMSFGNSDSALIGEWVLAVGNPFDLTSTVTAGIISAKGRNINILREQSKAPIESFIQTDAAVNPGNSGGALVDLNGDLIGINTAIATPTGTYAGYSFAVPVNIVKKVVSDIREYGVVQRAFLGVRIRDVDNELADEMDLNTLKGAYIVSVNDNSAADDAGLQEGDVVTSVNGVTVNSVAELQEQVSRYRPGDKVSVTFSRNGRDYVEMITLKNQMNTTDIIDKKTNTVMVGLGAEFKDLSQEEKEEFGIKGGVKIEELRSGKLRNATNIQKGFIITRIDQDEVRDVDQLMDILESKDAGEGVLLEGFYPDYPHKAYYYGLGL